MNESKYVYTYKHVQVWQGGAKKIIIAPKVFASRRKHPVPKGGKILVSGIPLLVLVGNVVNTAPNFWYSGYRSLKSGANFSWSWAGREKMYQRGNAVAGI